VPFVKRGAHDWSGKEGEFRRHVMSVTRIIMRVCANVVRGIGHFGCADVVGSDILRMAREEEGGIMRALDRGIVLWNGERG
jgi:hypothetical protein